MTKPVIFIGARVVIELLSFRVYLKEGVRDGGYIEG